MRSSFGWRLRVVGLVVGFGCLALLETSAPAQAPDAKRILRFDFGAGKAADGYTQVLPDQTFTSERGYGFEPGAKVISVVRDAADPLLGDFCSSDEPFRFSVALPEGNYNVTVVLGDQAGESMTTVRAESRRLCLESVRTARGAFEKRTFTVNIRTNKLPAPPQNAPGGAEVRLNERERGALHWDDRLTLEFGDARPCLAGLEIAPADDAVTVFLAGDSTVTDQPREPFASWGQMLPRFFKAGVAVANYAESGETLKSFITGLRLDKLLGQMKQGDYLFIQFGHNDMKEQWPQTYAEASSTYKAYLKVFIAEARRRAATPVLVTPVHRRAFDQSGKVTNTLGDYPEAMRQTAREENVALIDLNAMSAILYEALGPEGAGQAFQDGTHHTAYGAYELAKCVVEGIKAAKLGLAARLADDAVAFDPAKPDPVPMRPLGAPNRPGPRPANPSLPSLFLIGDSTVRNGGGDGANGQWGWGEPLVAFFDTTRINVVNRALGGRSSRTYLTQGLWEDTLAVMKSGDFVIMQFGHNDSSAINDTSRARGVIKGIGEETEEIDNLLTRQREVVHSYGWYLRRFIADTRAKGATPIVCSLVPRKIWVEGRIDRNEFAKWAREVAQAEGVAFIDLNEMIARRYEEMGPEKVNALFADEHTHTTVEGAQLNAACVVAGLKRLKRNRLVEYLKADR
jgi:lysophospholipase L1-like esterase